MTQNKDVWTRLIDGLCAMILICAVLVSLCTTYYATAHFLDGDASAEMVLAEHLAREGKVLSDDWYYSTELRVLNTQLVHTPLFLVFEDWHMVRFIGAMLLQMLIVGSYLFMIRSSAASFQAKCIGAALLILPISISYGRIVLYHTYYAPHIIISFSIVGLYLAALGNKGPYRLITLLIMVVLSFVSGLGGIRQFVITQAPLVLLNAYALCKTAQKESFVDAIRKHRAEMLLAIAAVLAFVLGFVVNDKVLSEKYWFSRVYDIELNLNNLNKLPDMIFGIAHQFGFRRNIPVLSIVGIASVCGLFTTGYVLIHGVNAVYRMDARISASQRVVYGFFAASMFTTIGVSLLTGSADEYTRHIIPAAVWAIPLLGVCWDHAFAKPKQIRINFVFATLAIGFLLVNALVNAGYFSGHKIGFRQVYEGLYENDKMVEQLEKPIEIIRQNGYTVGYSTRWESCTITELTDGQVTGIPVVFTEDHKIMHYEQWLSLRSYQQIVPEKTFLMIPYYLEKYYIKLPIRDLGKKIYQDEQYVIYGYDDARALLEYLNNSRIKE